MRGRDTLCVALLCARVCEAYHVPSVHATRPVALAARRAAPARLCTDADELSASAERKPPKQTYEVCHLDSDGRIEECEIVDEKELQALVGLDQAARVLNDPSATAAAGLLFGVPPNSTYVPDAVQAAARAAYSEVCAADAECAAAAADPLPGRETLFTMADWEMCLDDEECAVPDDVLLRALGPEGATALKSRSREGSFVQEGALLLQELQGLQRPATTPEEAEARQREVANHLRVTAELASASASASDLDAGAVADDDLKGTKARFHLHFGAGRLGMGLVVPAISASGIAFAVVQRPKPKWQELWKEACETESLDVSVNENVVVHNVKLISSSEGTPTFMPPQSLIFGSNPEELGGVVSRATSFSCSLGAAMSKVVVPLLETLPEVEKDEQPILFACENDHAAVKKLQAQLKGRVFVVDCMVDRVCTGRTIGRDGVDVQAEPWRGSIVVLEPSLGARVPFCSKVATVPSSQREADYLSERKFSLVNGMHTVVAFLTLQQLYRRDDGGREYILLKYDQLPRADQRMCEAWRTARVAQLISEFGSDAIMEWHGVESREAAWDVLLDFGSYVLEQRFSKVDDVVSRVLGGGVANRWLTRLRPINTWLDRHARARDKAAKPAATPAAAAEAAEAAEASVEIRAFFLYALRRDRDAAQGRALQMHGARLWGPNDVEPQIGDEDEAEEFLRSACARFTSESRPFCTKELEITHKALIKEQRKFGGKFNTPDVRQQLQAQVEKAAALELELRAKGAQALPGAGGDGDGGGAASVAEKRDGRTMGDGGARMGIEGAPPRAWGGADSFDI